MISVNIALPLQRFFSWVRARILELTLSDADMALIANLERGQR